MKRMTEDRKRQVATTRERHGKDFYKEIGKKSSGAGQTFRDPEKARAAARIRWAKQRKIRDDLAVNEQRVEDQPQDITSD